MVEDSGLTKLRKNYTSYSARNIKPVNELKIKNAQKELESKLVDAEILRIYSENNMSVTQLSVKLNLTAYKCKKLLHKRGLWDKIKEINNAQREKVKSSYRIAADTGVPRKSFKNRQSTN
jgi:hypothetical protein